jgi:hypothetical protein
LDFTASVPLALVPGIISKRGSKSTMVPRCENHFLGYQRVKNDPAGLAPDEGYVGEVEAADLVDARNHFVEPVIVVQYGWRCSEG